MYQKVEYLVQLGFNRLDRNASFRPQNVGGKTDQRVVVFAPFTIPKTKELIIQMGEKDGARTLMLRVRHRAILKARLLR